MDANMRNRQEIPESNIILKNRTELSISGVIDVESFNDNLIVLNTQNGSLKIRGVDFQINQLNLEVGNLMIDGQVDSLSYDDTMPKDKKNIISKIFS